MSPTVAILTDFGSDDWFVASMKGRILQKCPNAQIVDITHSIEPGNIHEASYVLASAYWNFPNGTVFLVVVDPGVGSKRAPMAAKLGNYYFILPDNGLLSHILKKSSNVVASYRAIETIIDGDSHTFHGRDIFAPAAGQLLMNAESFSKIGKVIDSPIMIPLADIHEEGNAIHGSIEYIDHYGNVISNLPQQVIKENNKVKLGKLSIPIGKTFSDVPRGKPIAYIGSNGMLEIAINQGSAQELLKIRVGDKVSIHSVND